MTTSKPVERTITVMEYMTAHPNETISLERLSNESGIAKSTLMRILNTFLQYGYITKVQNKGYISNFLFSKAIPLDANHLIRIEEVVQQLVDECEQSAEILTVNGKNLYWYDKVEHPEMCLRISAQIGFKRTLYELDAPARLYLKFLGMDEVLAQFDSSSFYTASNEYQPLSWEEAKELIEGVNKEGVEYDLLGNRNGIRRFATIISSSTGEFLYILCIAEPALLINDTGKHIRKNLSLLRKYRNILMQL